MSTRRRLSESVIVAVSGCGPVIVKLEMRGSPPPARYGSRRSDGSNRSSTGADVFASVAFYLWCRTEAGRRRLDAWAFGAPVFGPLFQKIALARFARVLAALVAGGIPIVQALTIARGVAGNRLLEDEIDRMKDGVVAGHGLSEPIRDSRVVPPLVVQMISVGEETGSVDNVLGRVARFYDRDVDYAVRNLSTALEPALLVVLGGAVLFTALAVFLPLWNLMNAFRH